jgi:serine/threonine kinase 38
MSSPQQPQGLSPPTRAIPEAISTVSQQKASASKSFLENHYRDMLRESRDLGARRAGPREKVLKADDFELIKCIGRGAFGEVFICQKKDETTGAVYAMKRMRKSDMLKKKQVYHVRSERDVLAEAAAKNPWIVQLMYSFQDDAHLYMVMEYMQGGDLISWLVEKETFHIDATRFYVAEMCAAVASVHAMSFVHRDIKPDNILLDANGHVKLSDFGLCKRFARRDDDILEIVEDDEEKTDVPAPPPAMDQRAREPFDDASNVTIHAAASGEGQSTTTAATTGTLGGTKTAEDPHNRLLFDSIVGSPGYIAPEILLRQRYGINCDWWSVGVIMYEMLYGCPPFYSEDSRETCKKIVNWAHYLIFPPNRGVPDAAISFMKRLLCDAKDRMTFEDIKTHPFFEGVDWTRLRTYRAAFTPQLKDPLDTKYFPVIDSNSMNDRQRAMDTNHQNYINQLDPRGVMFADFAFNSQKKK